MANMKNKKKPEDGYRLKLYSEVRSFPVKWLWYPYIPYGKLTLVQGDPGEGKSTMMMNIIAELSSGGVLPNGEEIKRPRKVIYQCSEDGAGDTIKPRLERAGADCSNIAFIEEGPDPVLLSDEKFRRAIADFNAKLLVIDPFQAYIGDEVSLIDMKDIRRLMHRLNLWAATYECAIVLIGHLNKKQGIKELYRSFGSVDVAASVRSILQVGRLSDESTTRYVRQIKNNLAPTGPDVIFDIDSSGEFQWIECKSTLQGQNAAPTNPKISKQEKAAIDLRELLKDGPKRASEIEEHFIWEDIGLRTVYLTKNEIGVKSYRKGGVWYWALENDTNGI